MQMKKKIFLTSLLLTGLVSSSFANEVRLVVRKPTKISFQIARQNPGEPIKLDVFQTLIINKETTIPIKLNNFRVAGLYITAVDGHELPSHINQFNQPKQCSMTTNKDKPRGLLELKTGPHHISCRTYGGVFG